MKVRRLVVMIAALLGAVAWSQLRITSFGPGGQLTFTNFASVGAYQVECANSVSGAWNSFVAQTNLNAIWVRTNRVTVQVPVSNSPAFYRVVWIPPDPNAVWDYRAYDRQGTLVVTGQLQTFATSLFTNVPGYYLGGSWNLQYAGPPTNSYWYVGPQIGTGALSGTLEAGKAYVSLTWPSNTIDFNLHLGATLWPNTLTGIWTYSTVVGPKSGPFGAEKHLPTN